MNHFSHLFHSAVAQEQSAWQARLARMDAVGASVEPTASGFRLTLDEPAYGVARGQAVSGSGRGTRVFERADCGWLLVHEHISPGDLAA